MLALTHPCSARGTELRVQSRDAGKYALLMDRCLNGGVHV